MPRLPRIDPPPRLFPVLTDETMSPLQVRLMIIGRELDMWTTVRERRMSVIRRSQYISPRLTATILMSVARIDARRRELRGALFYIAEQILEGR